MNITAVILLAFALVFALIEAWKGSTTIRPTSFGWLSIAVLILVELFFHGQGLFK